MLISTISRIITLYLVTVLGACGIDLYIVTNTIQTLLALGYKIDMSKIGKMKNIIDQELVTSDMERLTFASNLVNASRRLRSYQSNKSLLSNTLLAEGLFIPIDEKSRKAYEKSPTLLNSLFISTRKRPQENTKNDIYFQELDNKTTIAYLFNEENNEIAILKIKGEITVSEEELKHQLLVEHKLKTNEEKLLSTTFEIFESSESLSTALKENPTLVIERVFNRINNSTTKTSEDAFIREIKRILEEEKMSSDKQEETNDCSKILDAFYKEKEEYFASMDKYMEELSDKGISRTRK